MHSLLSATLDSSRRNNYSIPEPQRSASHTKSRAQPAQCYLQCAPSLASATHSRQAYKKHLILTQEIKRDIINHRVNLPPSARQVTNPQWLMAHLVSTFWRLSSYFQYISLGKFANAIWALQQMQEHTLDHPWPEYGTASFWTPLLPTIPREIVTGISYPMPTLDGTCFIYQHPQYLTAYSYITTHLTLPNQYWYNFYFLLLYTIYCALWCLESVIPLSGTLGGLQWISQCTGILSALGVGGRGRQMSKGVLSFTAGMDGSNIILPFYSLLHKIYQLNWSQVNSDIKKITCSWSFMNCV